MQTRIKKNILIFEKDELVLLEIKSILKDNNYHVLATASSKQEIIQGLNKYQESCELVIYSLKLPVNSIYCENLDFAQKLKTIFLENNTPCLYLLDLPMKSSSKQIQILPSRIGVIVKPFHKQELLTQVELYFQKQSLKKEQAKVYTSLFSSTRHDKQVPLSNLNEALPTQLAKREFLIQLGNSLRGARRKKRMTQFHVSEKLSINHRHYQDIEYGKVNFRMDTMCKLLNYIDS